MPVLANWTREQIRDAIGYNLMGPRFIVSSTTRAGGDATSVIDRNRLFGGDNVHNGKFCYMTSGDNDGEVRVVTDFVQGTLGADAAGSHDMTVAPGFGATVPISATYELWEREFPPQWVENVLDQVLVETYGRAYDPVEVTSLHTGGDVSRFDIPTGIAAIRHIEYRYSASATELRSCDAAFDESVGTGLTAAADTEDYRRGGASLKVTVAAVAGASVLLTDNITSTNISGKTHVEFWIKSSVTTAAGDIHILLDNTANCASALETLAVPALTADTWTFVVVALANPELDTAIISVGVRFTTDNGASYCWVDDIQAVNRDKALWRRVHADGWYVDKEARDLVLREGARADIGYALLKLIGGDAPALLSVDSTVSEVSATYLVAEVTAQVLATFTEEKYKSRALLWLERSRRARMGLARLHGARKVS